MQYISHSAFADLNRIPLAALCAFLLFAGCRSLIPLSDDVVSETEEELPQPEREFRAVWIATVANIDWPSEPGLPSEQQQDELIRIFDRAAALNFNAVVFQVRPAADALYESAYEPWASYISGSMGDPPMPYYDPLEFAIREAHRRGLEFHAWFNPFRAGHPADHSEISAGHISHTNPELVKQYGDFLWLDPGNPEAREHSRNVILDVVERYDIDGVHFDDYFYPYRSYAGGADFPDDESWRKALDEGTDLPRSDWRRRNVDLFIEQLSTDIKEIKPHVKFGISPFGVWQPGYPRRTTGFDAHNELFADSRLWLREGWVDYFTPQIYYRTDQIAQPYPVMLQWWVEQNEKNRHIWPGLYTSRIVTTNPSWPVNEIINQLYISRGFPGVTGAVHFSMQALMRSPDRFRELLSAGPYAEQVLVPESPWLNLQAPGKPEIQVNELSGELSIHMQPAEDEDIRNWVIRSRTGETWEVDILPGVRRSFVFSGGEESFRPGTITVAAVDRLGNMSEPATAEISKKKLTRTKKPFDQANLITRNDWSALTAGGVAANSIRRNINSGDTLVFRDLSIVVDDIISAPRLPGFPDDMTVNPSGSLEFPIPDTLQIELYRNGVRETFSVAEGEAFNWYGYHIGVLGVEARPFGLNRGYAQLELATVHSLSVNRAAALSTGDSSQRMRVPHKINRITLHHTGSAEPLRPGEDAAERVRALQSWSMQQNMWDLPYHFLIDIEGNVYEGRNPDFAGESSSFYDPRGHLQISVIGNYNLQKPTVKQVQAISELMAWAAENYDISTDEISGHSDWANTAGPGSHLRAILDDGTLIRAVEDILIQQSR